MSNDSDMDYSDNDNDCEFEDYYSPGELPLPRTISELTKTQSVLDLSQKALTNSSDRLQSCKKRTPSTLSSAAWT